MTTWATSSDTRSQTMDMALSTSCASIDPGMVRMAPFPTRSTDTREVASAEGFCPLQRPPRLYPSQLARPFLLPSAFGAVC
jgi:hypothetical protein